MNKVEAMSEIYIELSQRKEQEFIQRANKEWDGMIGRCPEWRQFVKDYVWHSWYELCRRN